MMLDIPNANQIAEQGINPNACRDLWCAVILEQWNLVFCPVATDRGHERDSAKRWFGSRDFTTAVSLAGLDPESVLLAFKQRIAQIEGGL